MMKNKAGLLLLLALGLFGILATSLYQRFANPSLTVNGMAQTAPARQDSMSDIGRLMRLVASNPHDRKVLQHLVELLMAHGHWGEAENFAQRALALDPADKPDPQTLYLLAIIHHNMGRHKEAAELLEKSLAQAENPSARYALGMLYLHFLNEPAAGIKQLEKALVIENLPPGMTTAIRDELGQARSKMPPLTETPIGEKE